VLRVAIVDDHPIAREGLRGFLGGAGELAVVACVAGTAELPPPGDPRVVDVVVLDLYLTDDQPALAAIRDLAARVPVLVMSASREPADVLAAMQAGASGYLTKNASQAAYLAAIRAVAAGEFFLSSQLADLIQAAAGEGVAPAGRAELSARERETLSFIARGFTHQQTATRMGVSVKTVNTYVARVRGKLRLGNKAELALASLRYLRPSDQRAGR
jgi:DNA-binding NarL/FixJ family response regulator